MFKKRKEKRGSVRVRVRVREEGRSNKKMSASKTKRRERCGKNRWGRKVAQTTSAVPTAVVSTTYIPSCMYLCSSSVKFSAALVSSSSVVVAVVVAVPREPTLLMLCTLVV